MKRFIQIAAVLAVVAAIWGAYTYVRISDNVASEQLACFDALAGVLDAGATPDSIFDAEYERLQLLVEKSLVIRSQMLEIANRLRINQDLPLSSRDLLTLKSGSEYYLGMREELYEIARAYECGAEAQLATLRRYGISRELRLKAASRRARGPASPSRGGRAARAPA